MNLSNAHNRPELIKKLKHEQYDLLIIGGGITGAGIALDAVTRGLKVALVEKNDFASGTSSKSTKLIHGGLRYLKQFEIALVREVGKERAVVHKLAPHLVKSEKMLLPLIKNGTYGKIITSFGLMIYDVLAGVEKADQRKMLSKEETLNIEPLLDADKLEGSGLYAEYRTDDARLTIEVLKTAAKEGAHLINYAEALDFIYDNKNKVSGVEWIDRISGVKGKLKASYVVSAAGPWVDELRARNNSLKGKHLHPTKGVHIVLPHEKFPVEQAVYFDVPDGRMIFAIPRGRITYVGTTDTDYHGDINDVRTDPQDITYLIEGVKHIFPDINLTVEDVESSWAGLRPLIEEEGKSASDLSRKDEMFESETGLISIAGGKLTGYRKMAERVVNKIVEKYSRSTGKDLAKCTTDRIVLSGGVFQGSAEVNQYEEKVTNKIIKEGAESFYGEYLVSNYGKQVDEILAIYDKLNIDDKEIRLAIAELQYTIENEAVLSVLDFFERRTGRLFFNIDTIEKLKSPVIDYMQQAFGWNQERTDQEVKWLDEGLDKARKFDSY